MSTVSSKMKGFIFFYDIGHIFAGYEYYFVSVKFANCFMEINSRQVCTVYIFIATDGLMSFCYVYKTELGDTYLESFRSCISTLANENTELKVLTEGL